VHPIWREDESRRKDFNAYWAVCDQDRDGYVTYDDLVASQSILDMDDNELAALWEGALYF
jgi:hypothetical protein